MILLSLLAALGAHAATGDFLGDLFNPGESSSTRIRLEERLYGRRFAAGQPFGLAQTRFEGSVPIAGGGLNSWRANTFVEYDAIESAATFSSGRLMPNRLWDVGAGVSHTHGLENGQAVGGNFTVSSPSDRPFQAGRDYGFNLNLTWRFPQPDGNAWIIFLGVSNTRGFLNYVPMPGAAYFFRVGKKIMGLAGVPFFFVRWQASDDVALTTFFLPLRSGEVRVTYGSAAQVQPYAQVSFRTKNYRLFDRTNDKERIFFDDGLAQAGVVIPLSKGLGLDLGGGQSFARRYYLAEKLTDRGSAPTIRPDNAWYGAAKVQAAF